ncbi:MAG: CehA/McbA family metallohydrolase, partial [Deltaproteobacteria bacterium]|nr:CehA/McbA family metallohydrolase [Deltaproteobacteria bacterium]
VEGARVAVLADGAFSTLAVTNAEGEIRAYVPAGTSVSFVVDGRGTGLWTDLPEGAGAYPPHGAGFVRDLALESLRDGAEPVPFARGWGWTEGSGPELGLTPPGTVTLRSGDDLPFEARISLPAEPSWADPALVGGYPSGYGALAWARDGQVSLLLEPGAYQVTAWRGPRYETASAAFEVTSGGSVTVDLPLAQAWTPEGWIQADFHGHASTSPDAFVPIEDRLVGAAGVGLQVWSASDHDHVVDYSALRDALGLAAVLALNTSEEITPTLRGHLNAWNIQEDPEAVNGGAYPWWILVPETTQEQFDRIRAHFPDVVLQANHPMSGLASIAGWSEGAIADGDHWSSDFDAVEVLNGGVVGRAVDFYLDLVSRGILVAPTGTSDSHDWLGAGLSFTWIGAGTSDPADLDAGLIAQAIRQRRTIASNGPFLSMDPEPGSEVIGPFTLEVRALGPSWIAVDTLTLYENGVPVASTPGSAATFEVVPVEDAAYVVVATGSKPMSPVSAATGWALASAILADADGNGWTPPLPPLEVTGGR